jgi:branched-subunit amino acid ABC-type transport system permease component
MFWVLGAADSKWGAVGLPNMEAIITVLAIALFTGLYLFVNRRKTAPQPSPVY